MRIAIVANTSWYLYNFRLNLMRALMRAGYEVVAIAPTDAYSGKLRAAGVDHHHFPLQGASLNPLREAGSLWALHRVLRQQRAQVLLSYTPKGNIYAAVAASLLNLPIVANVSGLGRLFIQRGPLTWVVSELYRFAFRRAPRVFFQNQEDMRTFLDLGLVSQEQAVRIPGSGVDLSRFAPPSGDRTGSDDGAHEGRQFVFLLVARMLWDKGIGEFVQAARTIKQEYPSVEFRLLGFVDVQNPSAIPRAQIEQWEAEGIVRYLGSSDDVVPHLQAADCVVLPSYREGVPRSLLEAAAMAKPLITTDAPGCRDTLEHGVTGFLCQPRDADDLAEKMRAMLRMPEMDRLAMGRRGREKMLREFDERKVIDLYLEVIASLGP